MNLMGRSSLDPRWTRHHTKVAAGFMLATIKVVRKIPGAKVTYDQATRTYSGGVETVIESVKARVQPAGISGDMIVGQDPTSRRLVRVQIENVETTIRTDDQIIVTACPDNPELCDYAIEVRGSFSSSNAWLTDLVCEANQKPVR